MKEYMQKIGLTGILWFLIIAAFVKGCTGSKPKPPFKRDDPNKTQAEINYRFPELLGLWQSGCDVQHFDRPAITSIEFRTYMIRWTNHFYRDKQCVHSDEAFSYEYKQVFVEDVRLLGDVSAKVFKLYKAPTTDEPERTTRYEVFKVEDDWMYISADATGPDFDAAWGIDSNFGLRRLR